MIRHDLVQDKLAGFSFQFRIFELQRQELDLSSSGLSRLLRFWYRRGHQLWQWGILKSLRGTKRSCRWWRQTIDLFLKPYIRDPLWILWRRCTVLWTLHQRTQRWSTWDRLCSGWQDLEGSSVGSSTDRYNRCSAHPSRTTALHRSSEGYLLRRGWWGDLISWERSTDNLFSRFCCRWRSLMSS